MTWAASRINSADALRSLGSFSVGFGETSVKMASWQPSKPLMLRPYFSSFTVQFAATTKSPLSGPLPGTWREQRHEGGQGHGNKHEEEHGKENKHGNKHGNKHE